MAVGIMMRLMANFLHRQLPIQQLLVDNSKLIGHAHGQKAVQTRINRLFLCLRITIPVDHLMRKALATATNRITDTGGADADAGCSNGIEVRHGSSEATEV